MSHFSFFVSFSAQQPFGKIYHLASKAMDSLSYHIPRQSKAFPPHQSVCHVFSSRLIAFV